MKAQVVSNKQEKALVVVVYSTKIDPKYKKRYKSKKKYNVSCSDSKKFETGQEVEIISCRPISKTIRFKVLEIN
jgi:ribosomal protein S17